MPRFLLYSESGDAAFLARRLLKEGHQVGIFIRDPHAWDVYKGIVSPVRQFAPADVVLFDMVGFGRKAAGFKKRKHGVIGSSVFTDHLELQRPFGVSFMQQLGIKVPEFKVFQHIRDGVDFLKSQKGTWFYKPSGNQPTHSTFSSEPPELIRYMEFTGKAMPPREYMLQKKIEGTEISLEGWFDGSKWVYPWNSTIEDKKFMAGDKGPRTGCMANAVWAYEAARPLLALKTFIAAAPYFEKAGYVGPVDLNMVIDKEGEPYGLEWSPRFGYDALQALSLLIDGDLGRQLADFAFGRLDRFETRTDAYGFTVNVSVPPCPNYEYASKQKGLPLDAALMSDPFILPHDVMIHGSDVMLAGADGIVASVGSVNEDLGTARSDALERVAKLKIPNAQYRIDPLMRAESALAKLSDLGLESGPKPREGERSVYRGTAPGTIAKDRPIPRDIDGPRPDGVNPITPAVDLPADSPTFNV